MKQSIAFTPSLIIGATIALSAGFSTTTYAAQQTAEKVERIQVTRQEISNNLLDKIKSKKDI